MQQLLHNELVPYIPFELKLKMAYQAAKGMHFLHSSGTLIFPLPHQSITFLGSYLILDAKH